jgi:hypothetical protein
VIARYEAERQVAEGPAPTVLLLSTRARAVRDAYRDGSDDLLDEALEALAAGATLVLDHRHRYALLAA